MDASGATQTVCGFQQIPRPATSCIEVCLSQAVQLLALRLLC